MGDRFIGETHMSLLSRGRNLSDMVIVTIRDISAHIDKIDSLRYRISEMSKMLGMQPSYVWSSRIYENGQELFSYISPVIEKVTGYKKEFFNNDPKAILNLVDPEDRVHTAEQFDLMYRGYDGKISFDYRILHADGTLRWLRSEAVVEQIEPGYRQIISTTIDITDRKAMELALEQSEQKYRLISENTKDVIWTATPDRKVNFITPSVQAMTGYSVEELLNSSMKQIFDEGAVKKLKKHFNYLLEQKSSGQGEPILYQAEYRKKDGSTGWCEIKMNRMLRETEVIGIQGSFIDISHRKQIEKVLVDEQKNAVNLILNSHACRITANSSGSIIEMDGHYDFLNHPADDLIGQDIRTALGKQLGDQDFFSENSPYTDRVITDSKPVMRIFRINSSELSHYIIIDLSSLGEHRRQLVENISMIQLILWS